MAPCLAHLSHPHLQLPPPAAPGPCNPSHNSSCVVLSVAWLNVSASQPALLVAAIPAVGFFASAGPDYSAPSGWAFVEGSAAPIGVNRIVALPGGRLWATASVGGVWGGVVSASSGGGWRVDWDVAGALADVGNPFAGIAVGRGGLDVAVMTLEFNSSTSIFRSLDGGKARRGGVA